MGVGGREGPTSVKVKGWQEGVRSYRCFVEGWGPRWSKPDTPVKGMLIHACDPMYCLNTVIEFVFVGDCLL